MATTSAHVVEKKAQLSQHDIIKFQLVTHCFMSNIRFSNNELDCLTLLGLSGISELSDFCNKSVDEGIFKTSQTVRNFLNKAVTLNIVDKTGDTKKIITLANQLQVQTTGTIVLDYKIVYVTKA